MIRTLTGTVTAALANAVIIDVNGVGYLVYTPKPQFFSQEHTITIQTYLAVRETALDLYGFQTETDLSVFEELLTIPKIGPKSALDILTKAESTTLLHAAATKDAGYLTKMSGIGAKTAEKIVAGLADMAEHHTPTGTEADVTAGFLQDAIDALITLGYPAVDARTVVLSLPSTISSTNEAVREALKQLGQT